MCQSHWIHFQQIRPFEALTYCMNAQPPLHLAKPSSMQASYCEFSFHADKLREQSYILVWIYLFMFLFKCPFCKHTLYVLTCLSIKHLHFKTAEADQEKLEIQTS